LFDNTVASISDDDAGDLNDSATGCLLIFLQAGNKESWRRSSGIGTCILQHCRNFAPLVRGLHRCQTINRLISRVKRPSQNELISSNPLNLEQHEARFLFTIQFMTEQRPTQMANGYELVDGVQMHAEQGDRFQIPHAAMKRHVEVGDFIEVRIDSARFSIHQDAPVQCECPHCNEATTKPVICHEEPASLMAGPTHSEPARGWGEQFWVKITSRAGEWLTGVVDNPLQEKRLHELDLGDTLSFHETHVLAIHRIHHNDLLLRMSEEELVIFGKWLQDQGLIP
jgi:hypothetical protein